jgi:hypothetical protein
MDAWGIGIFIAGLVLYFVLRRRAVFLFASGVGAGIVVGAVWAMAIVERVLSSR